MNNTVKTVMSALFWGASLWSEAITEFHVELFLTKDGSAHVTEKTTYVMPPYPPKRGMLRFIQTRYQGPWGTRFFTPLTVTNVERDNHQEPFALIPGRRGMVIRTGSIDEFIKPGAHQFNVTYTIARIIRSSPLFEELYWQVTGTSSRIPIQNASITIHPPQGSLIDQQNCYLYYGDPAHSASVKGCTLHADGSASLSAPNTVEPGDGLSISVAFAPGTFIPPTTLQSAAFFVHDNGGLLILLLGLFIAWLITLLHWRRVKADQNPNVVIPLFSPPTDLLPSECGYVSAMRTKNKQFAAELINLAISGFITIELIPKTWGLSREYKLTRTEKDGSTAPATHQKLLEQLFPAGFKTLHLAPNANPDRTFIENASKYLARKTRHKHKILFRYDIKGLLYGIICPCLCIITSFLYTLATTKGNFRIEDDPLLIFLACLFAPLIGLALYFFHIYTRPGCSLRDKIKGFRLFLTTTETARLELIGTPPTKTPELFEKYLPFAMALNAEKAWSRQFASVFDTLAKNATPYAPLWLHGYGGSFTSSLDQLTQLSSDLNHFVADTKAFSSSSSSGSNGGGSSGGGFGGGGIGSW